MHVASASNSNDNEPSLFGGGLQDPDLGFGVLDPLIHDIRVAVSSYLGLSVTLVSGGYPITVTELDGDVADITASLLLPLTSVTDVEVGSVLVLYAAVPGAFVDLAADLSYTLNISLDTVVLDQHLTPSRPAAGIIGIRDFDEVNRAVGILIDQGDTADQARIHLQYLADRAYTTVPITARRLIQATSVRLLSQPPADKHGRCPSSPPNVRSRTWPPPRALDDTDQADNASPAA